MRLDEYAALDATDLAASIRAREVTPREVMRFVNDAAELTATNVNAVAALYDDCLDADDDLPDAPFAGVPLLMKDVGFHEAGREATCGSAILKGVTAPSDSELMKRLKGAGFVSAGRSTASEFAIMSTVETREYGPTRNPWNPALIAGGSSGGSAAAVAAGIVPVAHGHDGGGSIRMPAACCGIVGLKPSRGLITSAPNRLPLGDLVYEFVLTRTVRDSAMVLDLIGGSHYTDAYNTSPPVAGFVSDSGKRSPRLRIGYTFDRLDGRPVEPEVREAVARAVQKCIDLGHEVIECRPSLNDYQAYVDSTLCVWGIETAIAVEESAAMSGRLANGDNLEGLTLAWAEHGRAATTNDLGRALNTLDGVRREMATFMAGVDVFLSSTLPVLPPKIESHYDPDATVDADWYYQSELGQLEVTTMVFNCSGQPAISVPLEWAEDGTPIGIHLAAPYGHDRTVLRLAAELEAAYPWSWRIPPSNVRSLPQGVRGPVG
jgi:amidase